MEYCKNIVNALDIFKTPMNLFFLSNQKISTQFNVFLSVVIYILLFVFFLNSDFLKKNNPKISDQILDNGQASITLNNDNYGIYFTFCDENGKYFSEIDPSMIKIELWQKFYFSSERNYAPLKKSDLQSCTKGNISAFCPGKDWHVTLNVSTNMWNGDYSYFQFKIRFCNNKTDGGCQTLEKIKQYINGKFFYVNFFEYNFDMRSLEKPVTRTENYKLWILNQDFYQSFSYILMKVDLYEDANQFYDTNNVIFGSFLQEDPKTYYNIYNKDINDTTFQNETLFDLEIYPSRNTRDLIRKYQKLVELISSLGGLATALQFIFGFLADISIRTHLLIKITKHLYFPKNLPIKFSVVESNHNEKSESFTIMNKNKISSYKNKNNQTQNSSGRNMERSFKENIEEENRINQINDSISSRINQEKNTKEFELQLHQLKNENIEPQNISNIKIKIDESKNSIRENKSAILKKTENLNSNLSRFDFVKYTLKSLFRLKLTKKDEFIKKSEIRFQNDFDFADILRRLMDLEKLKLVLLDLKQRRIFDSIQNFDESFFTHNQLFKDQSIINSPRGKGRKTYEISLIDQRLAELYNLCSNEFSACK